MASGWTVVLASLPAEDGRKAAEDKAKDALQAGLRNVGILDSGEFASLHPGYLVVFVGAYETPAAAQAAADQARTRGYDAAYIRQITVDQISGATLASDTGRRAAGSVETSEPGMARKGEAPAVFTCDNDNGDFSDRPFGPR